MRKELPVHSDFGFDTGRGPYVVAFVYPRKGKAFIVKGRSSKVRDWTEKNLKAAVVAETRYSKGDNWQTYSIILPGWQTDTAYLSKTTERYGEPSFDRYDLDDRPKRTFWQLSVFSQRSRVNQSAIKFRKRFRRPPRCWLKELNQFDVIDCTKKEGEQT